MLDWDDPYVPPLRWSLEQAGGAEEVSGKVKMLTAT